MVIMCVSIIKVHPFIHYLFAKQVIGRQTDRYRDRHTDRHTDTHKECL